MLESRSPASTNDLAVYIAPRVPGTPCTAAELSAYAARIIEAAGVEADDEICILHDHPSAEALVDELRAQADELGAAALHAIRPSEQLEELEPHLAAVRRMREKQGVRITLASWRDYDDGRQLAAAELRWLEELERGQEPSQGSRRREELIPVFRDLWNGHRISGDRWTVAPWPTRRWAEFCFPDADPRRAYFAFGQTLLRAAGASPLFGSDDYCRHLAELEQRAQHLNGLGITELKILDDRGTRLTIGVAAGARWHTCALRDRQGRRFDCNLPSAEIFTTPDPNSVRGKFAASGPVCVEQPSFDHPTVDLALPLVTGDFGTDGRLELKFDPKGEEEEKSLVEDVQELLNHTFAADDGKDRLGEIGLAVPSGPLAGGPSSYLLPMLDEQSAVHLGMGSSYSNLTGGEGTPTSGSHSDIVIGRPSTIVSGRAQDGEHLLIAAGRWHV